MIQHGLAGFGARPLCRRRRDGGLDFSRPVSLEAGLQRFQEDAPDGQFAVTPVRRLNQVPRALRRIGAADDTLAGP